MKMQKRSKNKFKFSLLLCFLLFCFSISCFSASENYPKLSEIEQGLYGKSFPEIKVQDRLQKIEKNIFGKAFISDSLNVRTERIEDAVFGASSHETITSEEKESSISEPGFENAQTEEVSANEFLDIVISLINNERSFKGFLPLENDELAFKVAKEHSINLMKIGYLSYFSKEIKSPDERYTDSGGTGVITEIIKGFELESKEKPIKLNELLARQLLQSILVNPDDSQIVYNPHVTNIGCGISQSNDKKKFISTIEFITKHGDFTPLKSELKLAEKIVISGRIKSPYKFKAVSIAYLDEKNRGNEFDYTQEINNDNLKPFFPPQDYIAYGDTGKSNLAKVLKGLGVIAAIGGAPFTGGATALLAPPLLSSIQNGPPKEIPLKGGIKVNSKGEFSGELELDFRGRTGLYFISVLAEHSGVQYPIVVSRRTVKVIL